MIRVGVVGAGMIGRRHIATAIASPDADLVGVADTLPADDPAVASLPCPYLRARTITPVPSGFVRIKSSPGLAPALVSMRSISTSPVTE